MWDTYYRDTLAIRVPIQLMNYCMANNIGYTYVNISIMAQSTSYRTNRPITVHIKPYGARNNTTQWYSFAITFATWVCVLLEVRTQGIVVIGLRRQQDNNPKNEAILQTPGLNFIQIQRKSVVEAPIHWLFILMEGRFWIGGPWNTFSVFWIKLMKWLTSDAVGKVWTPQGF